MITKILKLLNERDYFDVSKEVEIAKGKHYMPTTFKEAMPMVKRILKIKTKD